MITHSIPLSLTNQFSNLFLDYVNESDKLKSFYRYSPSIANFQKQIDEKKFDKNKRKALVKVLHEQYKDITLSEKQKTNLDLLLEDNAFTITTGHQLSLATGPLYFIYKILTAVNLSEELTVRYPANHFVPVFWMATEDHDIAEINHFYLFGKKIEWETSQKGATGRMSAPELEHLFSNIPDCPGWLKDAYISSDTMAEATRKVTQFLFSEYGLLVLDGDEKNLKSAFVRVIKSDILQNKYAGIVRKTSEDLRQAGYKVQAFARDINFFYLQDQSRERIEKQGSVYKILNTGRSFTEAEIEKDIEDNPHHFSPNVILRPLYQETLLPNLAYVGGPGELAYWLQLKSVFDAEKIPFPILFPRKFATILSAAILEKLAAAGIRFEDLFLSESGFSELIIKQLHVEKFDFEAEERLLSEIKMLLQQKAAKADKSFYPAIEAEIAKSHKGITELGKRLNKASEGRHQTELNKLQNLRKKLFPNNELQERHDNFLTFYLNNPDFIQNLQSAISPFTFTMDAIVL